MADFHELEDRCSNTQERKKLVQILSMIGGVDAKDNVKKIMEWLMHNSLMALFSMKGRSTKKASAFKTNMREGLTIQDIYKFTGDCLRYAPDRRGGGGRK